MAETTIETGQAAFPSTDSCLIGPRARRDLLDDCCRLYWKPVYAYFRALGPCSVEEARDLTQDFFCRVVEEDLLQRFDPARGRFRHFLKETLRNQLRDRRREDSALKRGGHRLHLSINAEQVESDAFVADARSLAPEALFDRQWMFDLLARGIERLESELAADGRRGAFELYRAYDLATGPRPTYGDLARRFGLREHDITNQLHLVRARLRKLLLDEVSRTCDDSHLELRELFAL